MAMVEYLAVRFYPPFQLLPRSLGMESNSLRIEVVSLSLNICLSVCFQFVFNLSLFRKQSLNSESKAFYDADI